MRLCDEYSVKRDSLLEMKLLCIRFCHLSYQTAAAMRNRAVVLHELFFDGGLTLDLDVEAGPPLLD
jgi:hypothetical protein